MQQHGLNDWKIDRQGHTHLNKTRFYESWFQWADQHTEEIHVLEYTHFLKDLCENMTIKDPRARKLRWRTFEEMLDRDRRASMAAGMFIKDVASDREYQRNKANRAAMALQRAYRRFMECRGACRAAAALRMRAELDTADQPAASFSNKRSSFDANRSIPPKARPNHTLPTANASPALGTAFDDDFKSAVEKAGDSLSQTIHHASTEVPPKATGVSALSDWAQLAETPLPIDDSISTIQTHEDLKERSVQLIQRTWRKWRDTAEPIDGNGSFMEDANSWMAEATRRVAARTIQSFGVRYVLGPSRRCVYADASCHAPRLMTTIPQPSVLNPTQPDPRQEGDESEATERAKYAGLHARSQKSEHCEAHLDSQWTWRYGGPGRARC